MLNVEIKMYLKRTNDMKTLLPKWKFRLHKIGLLFIATFFMSLITIAQDTITVSNPAGGFEIEGGLRANTPGVNIGDWLPGPGGTGGYVINNSGTPVDIKFTRRIQDPYNSGSDIIFQGSKLNYNIGDWKWRYGAPQSKSDIHNTFFHYAVDDTGAQWVFITGDRLSTSGSSYFDFEFNPKPV